MKSIPRDATCWYARQRVGQAVISLARTRARGAYRHVVSGSNDTTVRLWDGRTLSSLRVVPLGSEVRGLAMGKDSALAVSATRGLVVLIFP
jgi:WD40 repeat protein